MCRPNGAVLPFILLFISTSMLSQKSVVVFGSSVKEQSFKRPDPLHKFKAYNGGYDIQNKHYWASAAFTGLYSYVIAGVWVLFGLGFGGYMILKKIFNGSSSSVIEHSDSSYIILFSLVVLFTLFAIIASGLAIAADEMSISKTKILIETVLSAGGDARRSIHRINVVLREMQTLLDPYDKSASHFLNSTRHLLRKESRTIQRSVDRSSHSGDQAIETLHAANLVLVVINLALLVAGLVQLFMHWHPGFFIIIFFLWSLTTLNWILTGFDFFFHTFAKDTCSAFAEYKQNQNSSLRSMLSCGKSSESDKILVEVGSTVHNFVMELNSKLQILRALFEDNQNEGLLGGEICDPFPRAPNHSLTPQECPKDAIPITDLPNASVLIPQENIKNAPVLARYACYEKNSTRYCRGEGRFIPHSAFVVAWACSKSIQELVNIYPDAQSLTQCSSVEQALSKVVLHQCKPLKASIRMLWSSMLCLSIIMVALTLIWVAKAYQDWRRCYSLCSIIPNRA